METFWRDGEDVEQNITHTYQLYITVINIIILIFITTKYPCRISDLSGKEYAESLIQQTASSRHIRDFSHAHCIVHTPFFIYKAGYWTIPSSTHLGILGLQKN